MNTDDFEIENGVLIKYYGKGGEVIIPDSVTGIRNCAFMKHVLYTEEIVPNGVEHIIIPESVTSTGTDALYGCNELQFLTVYHEKFKITDFLNIRKKSTLESEAAQSRDTVSDTADNILNLLINRKFCFPQSGYLAEYRKEEYELAFRLLKYKTRNKNFLFLLRESLAEIFLYLLTESKEPDKPEVVQSMLDGNIFAENTIDKCIQLAIDMQYHEIQLLLTDYKYQHFEFKSMGEKLKL